MKMGFSNLGIGIAGAFALVIAVAAPPAFGSAPTSACDLVSAAAVSAAVGEQVQLVSTARTPKSLCMFMNFPKDPHATTKDWQPHFRSVTVALFNAATMSDPKVGSSMARVGCRTVVAKCQKALADRSPEELYNAQPRGAQCKKTYARCFFDADGAAVWAMQTGNVVAITVVKGSVLETQPTTPAPTMAFGVYMIFASRL